jgi:Cu/Ag efflux pump CusA
LPLALASGAGAGAMMGIGTAVTGGMVSATFIDLIFIPMFFVLISQLFARKRPHPPIEQSPVSTVTPEVS